MTRFKLCLALLLFCKFCGGSENYFSIVGPRSIQQGENYVAFLSSGNSSEQEDLEVSMFTENPKRLIKKLIFTLPTSRKISFDLKSQNTVQNYLLIAGIPKRKISLSETIFTTAKTWSVLIQTDKPVYKAGDEVKFRVLVIDKDTKPYQFNSMTVDVVDANKNKVKIFPVDESSTGFFRSAISLSDEPLLGKWAIEVKVNSDKEITSKNFEVRDYVLPRFEAFIATAPKITMKDENLKVFVFGRYAFDKRVKGKASLKVEVMLAKLNSPPFHTFEKKINLNANKVTFDFNLVNDLKIVGTETAYVKFFLTIEENLTGEKISTEKIVTVSNKAFEVERKTNFEQSELDCEEHFKPGLPYDLKVTLRDKMGELVNNLNKKLSVYVTYYNNQHTKCKNNTPKDFPKRGESKAYYADVVDGVASLQIQTENKNDAIFLKFSYERLNFNAKIFREPSRSRQYIKATVSRANTKMKASVKGTQDFSTLFAVVLGRSGLILSKEFSPLNHKSYEFEFDNTAEMISGATLFVYYYESSGEVIFDRVFISSQSKLPNTLTFDLPSILTPGSDIQVNLESNANSVVFLSAVDESVNFMKYVNDISRRKVLTEFLRTSKVDNYPSNLRYSKFSESSSIFLTNANNNHDCIESRFGKSFDEESADLPDDEISEAEGSNARRDFSETWLFDEFQMGNSRKLKVPVKVPDSITTWAVSGLSLSPQFGLGFAGNKKFRAMKDFFMLVEMPHSIILGERAEITIYVYNYNENFKRVGVNIMFQGDSIEIVEIGENCESKFIIKEKAIKQLEVYFNSVAKTSFFVRPTTYGDLKININATSLAGNDVIEKTLRVKYEGAPQYFSKSVLIDVRTKKFYSYYFSMDINRDNIVSDSVKVGASAKGNLMGSEIGEGPKRTGLGRFVFNLFNLKYLGQIKKLTEDKKREMVDVLFTGYQDLIKMRKPDGSFGTIRSTAFAVKCLKNVKDWIEIDVQYLIDALNFLDKRQENEGEFKEVDDEDSSIGLTAYTLIALLENHEYTNRFPETIKRSFGFIRNHYSTIKNNNELAMIAYAMALHNEPLIDNVFTQLYKNAIVEDDVMHWPLEMNHKRNDSSTKLETKIEIASYAVLAYLKMGKNDRAIQILAWLTKHKKGFVFAEDTVGLQALAEAAKKFHSDSFKLNIFMSGDDDKPYGIRINQSNELDQQFIELPSNTDGISVMANGTGFATLDVWWKFNMKVGKILKNFVVFTEVDPNSNENLMRLKACARFIPDVNQTVVEVAVMEIALPSGFEFDDESKKFLEQGNVKRFELRENRSIVLIYVEKMSSSPICVEVQAIRKKIVKELKKTPVKVYDLVKPENFGVEYYQLAKENSCRSE